MGDPRILLNITSRSDNRRSKGKVERERRVLRHFLIVGDVVGFAVGGCRGEQSKKKQEKRKKKVSFVFWATSWPGLNGVFVSSFASRCVMRVLALSFFVVRVSVST